ncbi:helix-turn-helix domain-containing protein [Psychromonas sp. CD1]|uniref:helix-turn-helix domain-containing protein n=1 Tax=Psychromonas sp. CD1 TaxID=1979839 RepID=UPI000B9C42DB|nr:AraC family transcriptional regulator [Psychromonas sp. CD1]
MPNKKLLANSYDFLMFDLQPIKETQCMNYNSDYILIRPKKSGCILHLSNTQHALNKNQLILLSPFTPFQFSSTKKQSSTTQYGDILFFRLKALGQTFIDSIQFQHVKNMLKKSRNSSLFIGDSINNIQSDIDTIDNSFEFKHVITVLNVFEKLSKISPSCYLSNNQTHLQDTKKVEDRVDFVKEFINNNLTESLSVSTVAKKLYMANSTFSRFFHANVGITFRQYLITKRVKKATKYLICTDWSISYIGAEVGFLSLSNFNSKFKSLLHVTPREYRHTHIDMRIGIECRKSIKGQLQKQLNVPNL